jgi:hypothetical protein
MAPKLGGYRRSRKRLAKPNPATVVRVKCLRHHYDHRLADLEPGSTIPLCCEDAAVSFIAEVQ